MSFYERALAIYEAAPELRRDDYPPLLFGMCQSINARWEYAGALPYLQRALAIFQRSSMAPGHPTLGGVPMGLARVLMGLARVLMGLARVLMGHALSYTRLNRLEDADWCRADAILARRSQVACAGPGCARKLREDGAPLGE